MPRPIAEDHADKRRAILKSAARLFADEGYGRASMTALAKACGISKANIYHYYASKDALLFDILDTHLCELRDRVAAVEAGEDADIYLHAVIAEVLFAYQGADAEHAVQLNAITALPEDRQEVLRGYQRDLVRLMQNALAALAPKDVTQDRAKMRALTMSVFAMLNWYYQWNSGAGDQARREYARFVAGLILNGLRGV